MSHVSQLVLDELASGVTVPPEARAHVEGCAECTARLQALTAARATSESAFGYARVKARVLADRPPLWRELMPFIVPAVAGIIFFIAISIDFGGGKQPKDRLKGGASIALLAPDGTSVTEAKPGTHLTLELGAAGNTHALVLAVDKDRRIDVLWSGALPAGAIVKLPDELEVTPGPVVVHAFLSKGPVDPTRVVPAMELSIRDYGGWPLEAPPPQAEGLTVVSQRLHVSP